MMIKPDGVQRGLVGEILGRVERKGYRVVALKMLRVSRELAAAHYAEHVGKPFYQGLVDYITSGPVVAAVLEGKDVISGLRQMMGATNPLQAAPGTMRGDLAVEIGRNVVHGSDAPASAEREIALYFQEAEIQAYRRSGEEWLYE